jgi:hypothetical protein
MSDTLPNFYAMRQKTNQSILETVKHLTENPNKRVRFVDLVFEFMRLYGIGETGLKNLLKPYITDKKVFLVEGYLVGPDNNTIVSEANNGEMRKF